MIFNPGPFRLGGNWWMRKLYLKAIWLVICGRLKRLDEFKVAAIFFIIMAIGLMVLFVGGVVWNMIASIK